MEVLTGGLGLVFGFTTLVFVHELGHYVLAKWNGVRVKVFSIGMGPYLISFTRGETVYAFSLVPIGGYVKMLGQEDMNPNVDPTKDPHDYRNKRPGQRAAILAAGAAFNLIFALFAFTFCYYRGVEMQSTKIGEVGPESPASKGRVLAAGDKEVPTPLKEGDVVVSVDGVPMRSFMDLSLHVAGSGANRDLQFMVERDGAMLHDPVIITSTYNEELGAATVGLRGYNKPLHFELGFVEDRKGTGKDKAVVIVPSKPSNGSPAAKAGVLEGDVLVSLDGKHIRAGDEMIAAVQAAQGATQILVVRRRGGEQAINIAAERDSKGNYRFGLPLFQQYPLTEVDPRSEAYAAGLREGFFLKEFRAPKGKDFVEIVFCREPGTLAGDETIRIPAQTASGSALVFTVYVPDLVTIQYDTAVEALSAAWYDLIRHAGSVFTVIRGLVSGQVSPKALSSPLGIGHAMLKVSTETNFMYYLWFLAFLSVNLGMLQFVPIPLLDGWHLLMIGVEKLKGGPVTPKVQEAFQYVGLAIILCLLLMAMRNDIMRIF